MEDSMAVSTAADTRRRIFAIVASASGNLVEWYDFYVYSFLALYFASEFFPEGDTTTQLLNAAAIFAAGFLMRPIGGWLFGRIADRVGRKRSMVIFATMMCTCDRQCAVRRLGRICRPLVQVSRS